MFWPSFLSKSVKQPDSEKGLGQLGDSLDLRVSASQRETEVSADTKREGTQKCERGREAVLCGTSSAHCDIAGLQGERLSCTFFFLLGLMCRDTWSRARPSEHQKPSLGWRIRGPRGRGHRHGGIPRAETCWRQSRCVHAESFSYLAQSPALVSSY